MEKITVAKVYSNTSKNGKKYYKILATNEQYYTDFNPQNIYNENETYEVETEPNEYNGKISYVIQKRMNPGFVADNNNKAANHNHQLKEEIKNGSILWQVSGKIATSFSKDIEEWKVKTTEVYEFLNNRKEQIEEEVDVENIPF